MKTTLVLMCTLVLHVSMQAQHKAYYPDSSAVIQQRLEAWQDLKFGLLMHWGPYSQWGIVESWSICPEDLSWAAYGRKQGVAESYNDYVAAYEGLQTTFNPVQFAPEKWAKAAKEAGMKYMVFTTKHHDGFCMFDSKYTDYKITDHKTPFSTHAKSNVTQHLFEEFRKQGLWIGAYFSKPDWHSNDYWWDFFPASDRNCNYSIEKYPERWKAFTEFTHHQIDELMSDYGKVDILWLDGGWVRAKDSTEITTSLLEKYEGSRWARNPQSQDIQMSKLVKSARDKQPGLIVVDRAVPGPYQNYLTPEQHIPEEGLPYPWETCMTMAQSWSYVPNDIYKTSDQLIENLVDIVSKGGNFLLNIGPSPEGEWDTTAYSRLQDMGAWMKQNGEAIYGTRMHSVYGEQNGVRYTRSKDGKKVYVFFTSFRSGWQVLTHLAYQPKMKARFLGGKEKINIQQQDEGCAIQLPSSIEAKGKYVWVVEISYP